MSIFKYIIQIRKLKLQEEKPETNQDGVTLGQSMFAVNNLSYLHPTWLIHSSIQQLFIEIITKW